MNGQAPASGSGTRQTMTAAQPVYARLMRVKPTSLSGMR